MGYVANDFLPQLLMVRQEFSMVHTYATYLKAPGPALAVPGSQG